jgi:hypothetical protein
MSIVTTVVARFVPRSLGTIGRDVAHLSTVEATAILGSGLVDHLPSVAFKSIILAVPGNVTGLIKIKTERNP